ncbi:MAG: putative glutaredoxin-like protein NrdH [Bacillota bacterium]|jgi:glutaredoxin
MDKAIILTKDNCPNCQNLKMFLKMAMRDQYKDNLREVHQTQHAEEFAQLTKQHNIMSTPAMIYQQDVIRGFEPQPIVNFLVKHFGKK